MGWAKYYEDNVSIYIGRMATADSVPLYRMQPCVIKSAVKKTPVVLKPNCNKVDKPKNQNGRRGLELTFTQTPEETLMIKLQMNGWWWSRSNNCWCNWDTVGNRKYAQRMISMAGACLVLVNI